LVWPQLGVQCLQLPDGKFCYRTPTVPLIAIRTLRSSGLGYLAVYIAVNCGFILCNRLSKKLNQQIFTLKALH